MGGSSKHAGRTTGTPKGLEASATSLHSSGQDSGIDRGARLLPLQSLVEPLQRREQQVSRITYRELFLLSKLKRVPSLALNFNQDPRWM